jgi:dephospho-CoA kinase
MKVNGLVGGIGSGKSRVAAAFARRGARVVSGDEAGHEALRQPEIIRQVVARWGAGVLDGHGGIDRRKLGRLVFADPEERRALEAIVFPWIGRRLREEVHKAAAEPRCSLVLLDAAVMLEAGWADACDRIVYVHAPREVRLRRLAEQRGWTEKEVEARERAQMALTDKATRADDAVDNSGTPEELARQVDELLKVWGISS